MFSFPVLITTCHNVTCHHVCCDFPTGAETVISVWLEPGARPGIEEVLCVYKKGWASEPKGWEAGWRKRPPFSQGRGVNPGVIPLSPLEVITVGPFTEVVKEITWVHGALQIQSIIKCCFISICLVTFTVNAPAFWIPLLGEKRCEVCGGVGHHLPEPSIIQGIPKVSDGRTLEVPQHKASNMSAC